jgi:hypothetical protein
MEQRGKPLRIEQHTFQRAACVRRSIIQAIEPEAEQFLLDAGGHVQRSYGDYVYEEYWDCSWPTLLIVWPPHTLWVYLAPTGQEDGMTIFLAALLLVSQVELHLTYDYRPFFLFGSFEEFFTLRVAKERIIAEREAEDESHSS